VTAISERQATGRQTVDGRAQAHAARPTDGTQHAALRPGPRIVYVAYPALTIRAANAIQTFATVRALRALAPDCELLVPRFGFRASAWSSLGARHLARIPFNTGQHVLRSTGWSYAERTWFAWRVLLHLLRQRIGGTRADVVYVRDAVCAAWLGLLARRVAGARVIYEAHNLEATNPSANTGPLTRRLAARIDRAALDHASAVVSLTGTFRDLLSARRLLGAATPTAIIPDAFDETVFAPRERQSARASLGLPAGAFIVAYTGLTFAYRGLDRLVAAFAAFHADCPNALLLLVGGTAQERAALQTQAHERNTAAAVRIVPPQPNGAIPAYLAAADALVLPDTVSKESASPLKLFEYAAMERPIIAVDLPALREILSDDAARYIPAGDVTALADALRWIASNPEAAQQQAVRARAALAEHTYSARAAAILRFCQRVTESDR
jgi:glycosyltransferase involved in cell wall biosynthesis